MSTAMPRILCVEDHEDTRNMLTFFLGRAGYFVLTAENATLGFALAQTQPFDLLVMDIWLPDEDGYRLCQRVREFDQYTPIVVYSGAATEAHRENGVRSKADAFVAKPNVDKLLATVKQFLD